MATLVLAVVATAVGLLVPGFYRDAVMIRDGQSVPAAQILLFVALSLVGLGLVVRFVRAIDVTRPGGVSDAAARPSAEK